MNAAPTHKNILKQQQQQQQQQQASKVVVSVFICESHKIASRESAYLH